MKSILILLISMSVLTWANDSSFFKVRGVVETDTLNMRSKANANSKKIAEIPYDGKCIENLGYTSNKRWCKIKYLTHTGWVNARFLSKIKATECYGSNEKPLVEKASASSLVTEDSTGASHFTFTTPTTKKDSQDSINDTKVNIAPKTKKIISIGYGITKEKALKSAFKSAVQQYVGVLVDTDTIIQNDQIIKDQILTASNGYIKSYEEISTEAEDGLISVKISAIVKSQKVFDKVKNLNIATAKISGTENIYARIVSKKVAKEDAEKILKKPLTDFFSKKSINEMLKIKITNVKIDEKSEKNNRIPVHISYVIERNMKTYSQKVKKLEQIFEGLGAKLEKRVDIVKNSSKINNVSRVKKLSATDFGIFKKYGKNYKLDVWKFPKSWVDIYPFTTMEGGISIGNYTSIVVEINNKNKIVFISKSFNLYGSQYSFLKLRPYPWGSYVYKNGWNSASMKTVGPFFAGMKRKISGTITVDIDLEDLGNLGGVKLELEEK